MKTKKDLLTDLAIFAVVAALAFTMGYFYNQRTVLLRANETLHNSVGVYDAYDIHYVATGETPK